MASSNVRIASCAFLRFGCSEHVLFAPTYTRYCGCSLHILITFESEDAAAAADRNRDLVVCARFESTTTSAIAGAGDVATAMSPEATVALPAHAITASELTATESDWLRAEKANTEYQRQVPKNTILYELNNCSNPMWYYSYESGSTKAQRRMKHVLAAYVLALHTGTRKNIYDTDAGTSNKGVRLATVITRLESPSFTMVSYRRQNDKSRSGLQHTPPRTEEKECPVELEEKLPVHPPKFESPLPSLAHVFQRNLAVRQNDESIQWIQYPVRRDETGLSDVASVTAREAASIQLQDGPKPEISDLAHRSQYLCCPLCQGDITLNSSAHRFETLDLLQPLLLLQVFMKSVPISAFTFCFGELNYKIQQWLARMPPVNQEQPCNTGMQEAELKLMKEVASTFSLDRIVVGGVQQIVAEVIYRAREERVLRSCANMSLSAFSSKRFQDIIAKVSSSGVLERQEDGDHSSRISCEKLYHLVAEAFDELEQLLLHQHDNRYSSIFALVDDVLSLIYSEPRYNSLRSAVSEILLHKENSIKVMLQDLYQVFEGCAQISRDELWSLERLNDQVKSRANLIAHSESLKNDILLSTRGSMTGLDHHRCPKNTIWSWSEGWNRRWFLDSTTLSIQPSCSPASSAHNPNPSLLSTLALIRNCGSLDLMMEGSRLTVKASMFESTPLDTPASTVLELDGQTHKFEVLPCGLHAIAASVLFGDSWNMSTYTGYVAGGGRSVEILLTLPPRLHANQRFEKLTSRHPYPGMELARQLRVQLWLNSGVEPCKDYLTMLAGISVASLHPQHFGVRGFQKSSINHSSEALNWSMILQIYATYVAAPTCTSD
ncbi:hypothetical protein AM587_10003833 [Phytophthora nicotianae]|nr:hypothetical protein AM587_10003833 [Phytophthora nicotianae]